ncbi:hypothetical protein Bca4012_001655 [Brassica carinata]|uniref:Uncharacterized protein n=1 Tax=Brassica carinata TaxID=52824 RepID=A0A8X7V243_BRACI|nr:hypothetical protein Bca52824_043525 [Brassica carinata]
MPCEMLQSPSLKISYDEEETQTVSADVGAQVGKSKSFKSRAQIANQLSLVELERKDRAVDSTGRDQAREFCRDQACELRCNLFK